MNTKVLVTGANGQLGSTIKELYSTNQDNIQFTFTTKAEIDISSKKEIEEFFKTNNFDYCINCAGYTNVEQAEKTPELAFKINAEAVKYLAQICKATNTIFIHISTDYVFDGSKSEPYTELDIPNPINEYGKSKLLGEQHIQNIVKKYFIIRTSWLYSKTYGKNFYKTILQKAKENKQLKVSDNQIGCPTNCVNLATFLFQFVTQHSNNYGIYHYCDDVQMTWFGFAKLILTENNLLTSTNLVKDDNCVTFAMRPKYSVLKKQVTYLNNL